jgi:hypothetical protein
MRWAKSPFQRSPLTDPRSLAGSLVFHGIALAAISATWLSMALPAAPAQLPVLRGEIDPVDNRVPATKGGSPGEIGGEGKVEVVPSADGTTPKGEPRDPATDTLLSEILPPTVPSEEVQRALPGPQTSGVGILSGTGIGGGGGAGGGSGGASGRGIGPGTEFFGTRENANSFAYVIDCSGSMAMRKALDVAKRELLASLEQLPPDAKLGVIFYNLHATTFSDPGGRRGLMPATRENKSRVSAQLGTVQPDGGTDHMLALRTAIALRPEVIFFLTDADLMTRNDVAEILDEAGKIRIQAIEFGLGPDLGGSAPLRHLAQATGGAYRYIDVTGFPKR